MPRFCINRLFVQLHYMPSSFRVYIDESGDEGFKFLPNEQGSSRWFVLSAVVIRKERDLHLVQLAKDVRPLLNKEPKHALHFRNLRHEQRARKTKPLRIGRKRILENCQP